MVNLNFYVLEAFIVKLKYQIVDVRRAVAKADLWEQLMKAYFVERCEIGR